jgi:hypothetical protein
VGERAHRREVDQVVVVGRRALVELKGITVRRYPGPDDGVPRQEEGVDPAAAGLEDDLFDLRGGETRAVEVPEPLDALAPRPADLGLDQGPCLGAELVRRDALGIAGDPARQEVAVSVRLRVDGVEVIDRGEDEGSALVAWRK